MNQKKKDLIFGILSVIGGMLIHFTLGYFYTIANMIPYMMSYARTVDPDVNQSLKIWLSALALGVQGMVMPLGGLAATKCGYRPVVAVSCLLFSGGVLLTSYVIQKSFIGVIITYSLILGAGMGLGYSVIFSVASTWFPARRGLIVGLIVGGFGLGALIFTPIQTAFINPDNLSVDKSCNCFTDQKLLDRVPTAFLLLGGILLGLQIIGFILLRKRPERQPREDEDLMEGDEQIIHDKKGLDTTEEDMEAFELENPPLKKVLRRIDFYLLWFVMFCNVIPITIITSAYKTFGHTFITDDRFLSIVVTISSIFNATGRIMWGALVDKFSFKAPLCILLAIYSVVLITFPFIKSDNDVANKALFIIWACLMYLLLSGVLAIMPAATGNIFGPANVAINYGMVFTAFAAGTILCGLISTFVVQENPYVGQFTGCGAVCLVALFTVFWIRDNKMGSHINICGWCATRCSNLRGPIDKSDSKATLDEYYDEQ